MSQSVRERSNADSPAPQTFLSRDMFYSKEGKVTILIHQEQLWKKILSYVMI